MKWTTLKYLCKEGIIGLWKNRTMAIASIGTIILCLLTLGVSYCIGTNIEAMLEQLEHNFGITAYINDEISEVEISSIKSNIEKMEHVQEVTYISKEQALKDFSEISNDATIFNDFKEDNPLPASFEIRLDDITVQDTIIETLNNMPAIDETVYLEKETEMFMAINKNVNYICYGIVVCLSIVGLLLMSNTIKLTVYVRRKEINIMKYVGATDSFIRLPFLIEGLLIGLIGSVIAIVGIAGVYEWVHKQAFTELLVDFSSIMLVPTSDIMIGVMPICMGLGLGIGLIGSGFAIHKHLKV